MQATTEAELISTGEVHLTHKVELEAQVLRIWNTLFLKLLHFYSHRATPKSSVP